MTIAFVFSGQGAQYEGMCRDLATAFPVIHSCYKEAEITLGYNPLDLTQDQLNQTRYTQPAIFTMSTAISRLLKENGIVSDCSAGLSLGEYTALVDANAMSFSEGLKLLSKRGLFMEEASKLNRSAMLAVINTPIDVIHEVCEMASDEENRVYPANYNMPGQVVVAGHTEAVERAKTLFVERGYKKCIPLVVSGAFHTPLMQMAADQLKPYLDKQEWTRLSKPVISNTTGKIVDSSRLSSVLYQQVTASVLWEDSVKTMIDMGVDIFVEIGPKKVLSKFIQKIDANVSVLNIEDIESFNNALVILKEGRV